MTPNGSNGTASCKWLWISFGMRCFQSLPWSSVSRCRFQAFFLFSILPSDDDPIFFRGVEPLKDQPVEVLLDLLPSWGWDSWPLSSPPCGCKSFHPRLACYRPWLPPASFLSGILLHFFEMVSFFSHYLIYWWCENTYWSVGITSRYPDLLVDI